MRILIALDSFKGALSSIEAGKAAAEGVKTSMDAICEVCAVGDGGEGSVDALAMAISNGNWKAYEVMDAFHQTITIKVLHFDDTGIPTAAVEAAQIFGLHHHKGTPQTIQTTSTYGLGMLIKQLKEEGLKRVLIFLGGSMTCDGGLGLLQALGVRGYDAMGKELPMKANPLWSLHTLDASSLQEAIHRVAGMELLIGCDVDHPLYGPAGCAFTFARQKGAVGKQLPYLDMQLRKLEKECGRDFMKAGCGAAGGCGGAFSLLEGKLTSGFALLQDYLHIEAKIKHSDLVITGEGQMDHQSLHGKLPVSIAALAKKHKVPVIALCGQKKDLPSALTAMFQGIFSIQQGAVSLSDAIAGTRENIKETTMQLMRFYQGLR